VSPDTAFAAALGGRLEGWGLSVALESDAALVTPSIVEGEQVDVVLLDVRRAEDGLLRWLAGIKQALPTLEVILLSLAGEVRTSMEGMRAGATAELPVPLDTAALQRTLSAALRRRHKRLVVGRPSILERFQRAMTAATFAQAGEFDAAVTFLDEGAPTPAGRAQGKKGRT
jgi:DNA-binding NtrC family response regulator